MQNEIKNKNIVLCVLLTFVTCGFYGIYWFYSILADTYRLDDKDSNILLDFILIFITCGLYSIYLWYKIGTCLSSAKEKRHYPYSNNSVLYIIFALFGLGIINFCIAQNDINNLSANANVLNNNSSNNDVTYTTSDSNKSPMIDLSKPETPADSNENDLDN